jgi:hypothetical protein
MDDKPDLSVSPDGVVEAEVVDEVRVVDEPATPWGFWATIGLSITVLGVLVAVQTAVAVPFVFLEMQRQPAISPRTLATNLECNGLLLSLATLLSAPPCIGLVLPFARRYISSSIPPALSTKMTVSSGPAKRSIARKKGSSRPSAGASKPRKTTAAAREVS